jgi:hypothetical protein
MGFLRPIQQNAQQSPMAFQGLCDPDFDAGVGCHQFLHQRGEIPFQVDSESQEIRNHHDMPHALGGQPRDRSGKIRLTKLQKCRFHLGITSGARKRGCDLPNTLVGGFDARAMPKNDESALFRQWS